VKNKVKNSICFLQTWEEAIKYCKELAEQYEKETFQYSELAEILVSLCLIYYNGIL
jgi:hypothetical protein